MLIKNLSFYKTLFNSAFLLFVFCGINIQVWSQVKLNKEQKSLLKEADYYYKITDYVSANKIYLELYKADTNWVDLNYKIGVCLFKSGDNKEMASTHFAKAAIGQYNEARYYLAQCYHFQNRFDEEIELLKRYKSYLDKKEIPDSDIDRTIEIAKRAKDMMSRPFEITIENMGTVINTKFPEYVPLINADESMLIFTSRREGSTGEKLDPYNQYFEDIYISDKIGSKWGPPESIGTNINSETHDACVGLSSDGNTLIIFRTDKDLKGGDLYLSKLQGDIWLTPEKLGNMVNSEYNEPSACLNVDGMMMYFSSNRPGGYGGKDLYRITRFANGDWSLPMNLGPTVNTSYDDDAPFLHPDGVTLYFSSKGHETIGGYDIYETVFNDSIGWSKPQNLGYPINTTGDDIYFVLSTDGKRGYYSSGKEGGQGGQDIYVVHMPSFESRNLIVVKGKVMNTDNVPLSAQLTVLSLETGHVEGMYNSNIKTGKYIMVLKPDTKYVLQINSDITENTEEGLFFPGITDFTEIEKDIVLKKKQ